MSAADVGEKQKDINNKPAIVQKIEANIKASEQFDQQHQEWEITKKIAKEVGQPVPEEPQASPDALQGDLLIKAKNDTFKKIESIYDKNLSSQNKEISVEKRKKILDTAINNAFETIKNNPDEDLRVMQVVGALDAVTDRIFSTKWEENSRLLDISPEALFFSKLPAALDTYYFGTIQSLGESFSDLKTDAVQNVLKHLSSESSPLDQKKKEICQLYIKEGQGAKIFDAFFMTRDVYEASGGHLETPNFSIADITTAFAIDEKYTTKIKEIIDRGPKFGYQNKGTLNSVPSLISQLVKENPELAPDIQGKLIGFCKSFLRKRPDLSSNSSHDQRDERLYVQITEKVADSLMNLYDLDNIDFLEDIVLQAPSWNHSVTDREIGTLFLENGFRIPSVNDKLGSQHIKIIDKINATKRAQEAQDLEVKQNIEAAKKAEQAIIDQKDQEQVLEQFSKNNKVKEIISSLINVKETFLDNSLLNSTNKSLDAIAGDNHDLEPMIKFAKDVVLQFIRYTKDSSLASETKTTVTENKFFRKKERPVTWFQVKYDKVDELKKEIVKSNSLSFNPDNQIKIQALELLLKRSDTYVYED
jgi:hypothetical protein